MAKKFNLEESSLFDAPESLKNKTGRPRNDRIIRDNSVQDGLPPELARATFIAEVELLEKLKDYAYTERLTLKEVFNNMLREYIDTHVDEKTLLHRKK